MRKKPAPSEQLRLVLPARKPVEMSNEAEQCLVTALADLLLAVATGERTAEGGGDEREDPQ